MEGPVFSTMADLPVHPDAVPLCTFCACLCHDVRFDVEKPEFHGCSVADYAVAWIEAENFEKRNCVFTGKDVDQTADWLVDAVRFNWSIAFTGLESASCEVQKAAIALAETVGAWVVRKAEIKGSRSPWAAALAQKGCIQASWSEIRQRSDSLLLWYADLWHSHPRWAERFGPRSERAHRLAITPSGLNDPKSGLSSEQIVCVDPGHACEFLRAVRAAMDDASIEPTDSSVRKVVHMIRNARWLAIVRSTDPSGLSDPFGTAETFADLVAASNQEGARRVVTTCVPESINEAGLDAILSMKAGLTTPLLFTPEGPLRDSGEWSADDVDLFICFSECSGMPERVSTIEYHANHLESLRYSKPIHGRKQQRIEVPFPQLGVEASGTLIRGDGVPVPVRGFKGGNAHQLSGFLHAVRKEVHNRLSQVSSIDEPELRVGEPVPGAVR